ncbi:FKBP-type peptidyl-prolyl cis-trans isomerase [Candidatus Mancarchaeum acidiphilum]|nr:peptidylprolyl isomerase [Candidatus Mancarchaeum acidiphilum]
MKEQNSNTDQKPTTVEEGDEVEVYYTGKLQSGEVFDSNEKSEPLKFKVGSGEIIKGFDDAVRGMKEGESKDVEIEPKDAYGEYSNDLSIKVPLSTFGDSKPVKGMGVETEEGQQGIITDVNDTEATVDFNPPLAGKVLKFNIKVSQVKKN